MVAVVLLERLESRRLLCEDHDGHDDFEAPIEVGVGTSISHGQTTDLGGASPAGACGAGAASIVWTNRGSLSNDSDLFNSVFGTNADLARGVVDAVIQSYLRMIGSFNYSDGSNTYSVSVSMSATGTSLGASANLQTTLGGKPLSGGITMGRGGDLTGDGVGDGIGWFLDPTPLENSEFQGNVVNAYAGDAASGSPAVSKSDFFTVVAAELTHCLGLYGGTGAVPLWDSHTTNTGIADTSEGGGFSNFWVFQGPSIKHLLTGYNAGTPNSFNGGVHSGGPNVPVAFGGDTYVGSQDQGNARYEYGRRYLINNAFALMFKDAYGYSTVNPDQFGTMYSNLNTTTHALLVRGNSVALNTSSDTITISRTGSTLMVAVDLGTEVGGIGAMPGTENLPAFVSTYDISQVTSISIQGLAGNDTINIDSMPAGIPVTISGGDGNDTINIGGGSLAANVQSAVTLDGDVGTDTLNILDASGSSNDTYMLSSGSFTKTGSSTISYGGSLEKLTLTANSGNSPVNVLSTMINVPVTIDAGPGTDAIAVSSTAINAPVTILASTGLDTVSASNGSVIFVSSVVLGSLSVGAGGLASIQTVGSSVLNTRMLSITADGAVDIANNAMVIDYSGASPLGSVTVPGSIANLVVTGFSNGSWNGQGIRSITAATVGATVGVAYGESTDIFSTFPATFVGQPGVDQTAVVIRFTLRGDANLNQSVDTQDFNYLAANWGASPSAFTRGDFSYDGSTDTVDFNLLSANFAQALPGPSSGASAPSPAVRSSASATRGIRVDEELSLVDDILTS